MRTIKNPNGYWTKERCQETALKYYIRKEFRENEYAYQTALKNGWLDDICYHMKIETKKPAGYWTKERCQETALKYHTRKEFRENEYAYQTSLKKGWLDDICYHMKIETKKPIGYWTKERCKEKSLLCFSIKEFKYEYNSAYASCLRNGWLNDVCSHLKGYKSHNFWTKEECQKESIKYKTKKEFRKNNSWAYRISLNNNWIEDICSHMKVLGNLKKRCIYVYEFSDKSAYIGLTCNVDERHNEHLKKGSVCNHMKMNSIYTLKKLTDYIDVDEAKLLEGEFVKKYKLNGWKILNKIKTGGTGGKDIKWNKEKCYEESLKYLTTRYFKNCNRSVYNKCKKNKWLKDFKHLTDDINHIVQKPSGYWSKDECYEESLKCKTKKELARLNATVYNKCCKNKWINEFFPKN